MKLPSVRTILKRTQDFRCEPGLKAEMFLLLKRIIDEDPQNSNLAVAFDEMAIKKRMSYNKRLKQLFPAHKVSCKIK